MDTQIILTEDFCVHPYSEDLLSLQESSSENVNIKTEDAHILGKRLRYYRQHTVQKLESLEEKSIHKLLLAK
jgi:hypothetical protein